MSKTANGLLAHCRDASAWKYVYGAKGKILSRADIQKLKNMYGSLVWDSDLSKAGSVCCDCSGLISSYTGIVRSSANYKATAMSVATIPQLKANWEAYVGWGIWLNGHVGVVSDTEGYYYAMDGSARNWVHYPLNKNNWRYVIKLKDIDYVYSGSSIVAPTTSATSLSDIDVTYRSYSGGKWLGLVTNCNDTSAEGYAGIEKKAISALAIKSSKGTIRYQVHVCGGQWLPWVTGCDINDSNNGYAGIKGKNIDAVRMEINGVPGYNIMYNVSTTNSSGYLGWVTNYNLANLEDTNNGYAGIYKAPIDKIQIKVVRK